MLLMPLIQLTQMLKVKMWMQSQVLQIKHKVPQYKIRLRVPQFKTQLQGPADQNQGQVPVGQVPAQGPIQIVQNVPVQPLQQLVPMQPAPAGIVLPTSQIFYHNWIGKKPEFSGKPEEDAESHLLSMRDWMEVHNFPEGEKVRHFCMTLIGEARLWYESLAPLDNDWPALQNKFRWQYSKIGNTPKQLFHAWRTFKFDESTDSIDSYILRMSAGCGNAKLWRDANIREL